MDSKSDYYRTNKSTKQRVDVDSMNHSNNSQKSNKGKSIKPILGVNEINNIFDHIDTSSKTK